jgi:glycosyltransferase involved in cell wall biosynthesis
MDERKHLTLLYVFDENWIGGTYYILNIIKALNTLSDDQLKPNITVVYQCKSSIREIASINYPYINYIETDFHLPFLKQAINIASRYIIHKNIFEIILPIKKIDFLYPLNVFINTNNIKNACYWIPDFQEKYLPHFFNFFRIQARHLRTLLMIKSGYSITFSSFNTLNDFNNFYPNSKNKTIVIPFVSIVNESYKRINFTDIKEKYNLPDSYFICSNQFWEHKNHRIVLHALKILKDAGIKTMVVFTGKEYDYKNPKYFYFLQKYIKEIDIQDYVSFLGFIERDEQLRIMDNAISIIQPSLFEGWSTVVEDAKALNKFIIVSDIPIHREQIQGNCFFFNPNNSVDLANKMRQCLYGLEDIIFLNYDAKIQKFAIDIINLMDSKLSVATVSKQSVIP